MSTSIQRATYVPKFEEFILIYEAKIAKIEYDLLLAVN